MTIDPTRLVDPASSAPESLRELLQAASSDGPSPEQLQRLTARLAPQLGPAAAIGPRAAAGASLGTKFTIVGIIAVVAVATSYLVARSTAPDPRDRAVPSVAVVAPPPGTPPPPVEAPPAHPPLTKPAPVRTPPPVTKPIVADVSNDHVEPSVDAGAPPPVDDDDEITLLGKAQRALRAGDGRTALDLTEAHTIRFPSGTLGEEREAIAIEALIDLDRVADARLRLDQFRTTYPRSSYRHRLDRLVDELR